MTPRPAPSWLDRTEYPFQSKFFKTSHGYLHYVDEGSGDVILFVHGNPTWSFEHRQLIKHFRTKFRCIATDYIGFGLSDKPFDASYLPRFHAENLANFIDTLGLKNMTLVVHDWGGPVGMSYALEHPANIKRIIVYNSWFWSVKGIKAFERFSSFMGGPIGRFSVPEFQFLSARGDAERRRLQNEALEIDTSALYQSLPHAAVSQRNLGLSGRDHRRERMA